MKAPSATDRWRGYQWFLSARLVDSFFTGSSEAADILLTGILKEDYLRIQPEIGTKLPALDDHTPRTMKLLDGVVRQTWEDEREAILQCLETS